MALPPVVPDRLRDLDSNRTFIVGAQAFARIFGIFTIDLKGRLAFVDIAILNDYGNVEFFNDKLCPCKRNLREPGRSQCAACRQRGRMKLRGYQRRRRARKERLCSTESSSTLS